MNGKLGCPLCNGSGKVIGDFGLEVECECVREIAEKIERMKVEPRSEIVAPNIFGEMEFEQKFRHMKLVPEHRIHDDFSSEHVKIVAVQMATRLKSNLSSVADMNKYLELLEGFLSELRCRRLPKRSYIIGASNGLGKTTFANTAIKIMASNGMKAVPYIALVELAEKWADAMARLRDRIEARGRAAVSKVEVDDEGEELQSVYDWEDYVNSDLAIVSLTSTNESVMLIETQCLKALLELRDAKGKPTIVFTSESLDWYMNSEVVSKYIMSHIIENNPKGVEPELKGKTLKTTIEDRYDKLEHISVYFKPKKD